MASEVRDAFRDRPRLVDVAPGFLGLEVFGDTDDDTVFHLFTRWSDRASFEAWHHGDAHRASHAFMPRGLKLDATFTRMEIIERLADGHGPAPLEQPLLDATGLIHRHLTTSRTLCVVVATTDGTIVSCNAALAERLGTMSATLIGQSIWSKLVDSDADTLQRLVRAGRRDAPSMLLNWVDADHAPFTLSMTIDVQPDRLVLIGEPLDGFQSQGQVELRHVHNEMAVLAREQTRQRRALEVANAELERTHLALKESHWHLKKIQQVLPICMECHKVKTSDGGWDELIDFFRQHSNFLSHGYCPECAEKKHAELDAEWAADDR